MTEKLHIAKANFDKLKDIHDTPRVTDKDEAVLREIGEIILRHGQQDRIGLVLVHKHFNVKADEVAVEQVDQGARTAVIDVEKDGASAGAVPSMLMFSKREPV